MLRLAAIILVSIIHFTISQAAFSQYPVYLPKLPGVGMEKPEERKAGTTPAAPKARLDGRWL